MAKHLILFILIFSFMACNKDDDNLVPDTYTGTASALKNGEEWNALAYFDEINTSPSSFILRVDVYNNEGLWRETFDIRRVLANFSIQEITSTDNQNELGLLSADYSTILSDGDVLGDIYDLDTTATNNFIQITSYNPSRAEINGIFNVSLILTRDSNELGTPPQNLVFTNGEFTVKVQREWFE
ncbi:MAG: hypothetical protein GW827_13125 [Flavobacteriales bacterium]|nr:hypothetical protein [Flavobacteriales bacterium]